MRASVNCLSIVSADKNAPIETSAQFIKARHVDVGLGSRRSGANRLSPAETRFSTIARRGNAFIDVVSPFQCGAKRVG
jgi:hypothetical protein